jgi:hypothetical protein
VNSHLLPVFEDKDLVAKIQRKLPFLFELAEAESQRAGRVGMEVGSKREQILVALLMYKFGEANVQVDIPITATEVDALVFGEPISVKTVTGLGSVKVVWTVDWQKVQEFKERYQPSCDILLAQIQWGGDGGLFLIPKELQSEVFSKIGRDSYLLTPRQGTNPRGVEISRGAFRAMLASKSVRKIPIRWQRSPEAIPSPYQRWLELWRDG